MRPLYPRIILPDITTPKGSYILGLIWGTVSYVITGKKMFCIRHQLHTVVRQIKRSLNIAASIEKSYSNTDKMYRCKIQKEKEVLKLETFLKDLGWTSRQAEIRIYPEFGKLDDKAFIRAWCFLHSGLDTVKATRPIGTRKLRLRIYGNKEILSTINQIIANNVDVNVMKLQKASNEITKVLYYQGTSAIKVCEWLGIKKRK